MQDQAAAFEDIYDSSASASSRPASTTATRRSVPCTISNSRATTASPTTSRPPRATCTSRCTRRWWGRAQLIEGRSGAARSPGGRARGGRALLLQESGSGDGGEPAWAPIKARPSSGRRRDVPAEFLEYVKIGSTRRGVRLHAEGRSHPPAPGSTPVDFAYHSTPRSASTQWAPGSTAIVPLRYQLVSGDTSRSSPRAEPAVARLARLRRHLARAVQDPPLGQGAAPRSVDGARREMFEKECGGSARSCPPRGTGRCRAGGGLRGSREPLRRAGQRRSESQTGLAKIFPIWPSTPSGRAHLLARGLRDLARMPRAASRSRSRQPDDHLCKCCSAVPGPHHRIVTRGRGVTVHRLDCPNAFDGRVEPSAGSASTGTPTRTRRSWSSSWSPARAARAPGRRRQGHLRADTNIRRSDMKTDNVNVRGTFFVEVKNLRHLDR